MSGRRPFPCSLLPSGRQAGTVALALLLSLIAHLFIIEWAKDQLALISLLDEDDENIVQFTLQASPSLQPDKVTPTLTAPVAETLPPLQPATVTIDTSNRENENETAITDAAATEIPVSEQATQTSDSVNNPIVASAPDNEPVPADAPAAPATPADESNTANAADTAALFSRISLPPSADLIYDAIAIKGNSKLQGRGLVKWVQDGRQYSITGEASVLFMSVLSYRSEGYLNELGIMPALYVEKRLGKSSTNTHFHRERQIISFSASTNSYLVKGGEQDRATVFWQLAGLARGNPEQLRAGLSFDLIIAGSRTTDPWRVTIQGLETVSLAQGSIEAWHMSIVRQEGYTDYQLDVWIAPTQDWYPVKIMYIDRKGSSLGLSLSTLEKK